MKREAILSAASVLMLSAYLTSALPAHASCGGATCTLNTHWDTQGLAAAAGWGADVRYEYINQNQLRHARAKVSPGALSRDHDELDTLNRNWVGTLDYSAGPDWGVAVQAPLVQRVNGVQLTANWTATLGVNTRF